MLPTLVIPDTHIPFEHRDALAFVCAVRDKYRTEQTIHLGDELDFHASSYHDHNPDLPSAGDELRLSVKRLAAWRAEFPTMRLCDSNHGSLLRRKAMTHGLPAATLTQLTELYGAPGWTWHREIVEDMHGVPVIFRHAFGRSIRSSLGRIGDSCAVWGHYHTVFGVEWRNNLYYRQFAACGGCLIDPSSPAFDYDRANLDRPMLGCLVIVDGNCITIPMFLNRRGRWIGRL